MITQIAVQPKELFSHHMAVLRAYAQRVLRLGPQLSHTEERDKATRMKELLALGSCFGLTKREIVNLILREIFVVKRGCDCPTCLANKNAPESGDST